MKIDLLKIRKKYKMKRSQFAEISGLSESIYINYETDGEMPSKYVLKLWQGLDGFPLPDDFFYYTSFTLLVNMHYHKLTQTQIADMFDIGSQASVSGYMKQNIPMYEKKEYFCKFEPFIIPYQMHGDRMEEITALEPEGNFMLAERRKVKKSIGESM